jgi:hypothetical protein
MIYRFLDGKSIIANSPEEFVEKMRQTSWYAEETAKKFMYACSKRGHKIGLFIRYDTESHFLNDLIDSQIVAIEYVN